MGKIGNPGQIEQRGGRQTDQIRQQGQTEQIGQTGRTEQMSKQNEYNK